MFPIAKILLPVDFSERASHAARFAVPVAEHFHSQVVILHVLPPPFEIGSDEAGFAMQAELVTGRRQQARQSLDDFLADAFGHLEVRRVLREGDPAHEIVDCARAESASLVVMSTHGYGPFRRLLLGSVTAKVLNDAHCPVWTGPHLEAAPGIPEIQFRRILCAIDLATGSPAVLEWAEEFARAYGAGLAVVHILPESFIQLGGIYFDPEWRRQVEGTARERLQQLREARGSKAELLVEFGEVPASVAALARRWAADLLVIGRGSESGMVGRLRAN